MGYFLALAQEGVNDAKKVENELKEDKDHISVPTCKSATFTFMSCYKHPTSSFFLATLHRPTLELALHLLDRLNARPSAADARKYPILNHIISPTDTQRCAHIKNSIACPLRVNFRAFQPNISDNSQNRSACHCITCDGSKQQAEEGWMRFEEVKC